MGGYPDPPMKQELHPRAVKSEAASIAEANKGGDMKNLLEEYGNLEVADKPAPRIKGSEANEYAERNHGNVR